MNFEWDEAKSETCFQERGFDFAYAARAFFDPDRIIQADTRHSYGEERYQLMGNRTAPVRGGLHPQAWRHAHHLGTQSQPTRGQAL
jgi:hypothetical protein